MDSYRHFKIHWWIEMLTSYWDCPELLERAIALDKEEHERNLL